MSKTWAWHSPEDRITSQDSIFPQAMGIPDSIPTETALAARLFEEADDEADADLEIARRGSIARALSFSEVAKVWEEVEAWKPSSTPASP